jgi:hypothetical protein
MKCILASAAVLCGVVSVAVAANQTSTKLLAIEETKQFAFWTLFLRQSGEPCDAVNRVMYQGS